MQMKNANVQVKEKQKFIIMNFKNEFFVKSVSCMCLFASFRRWNSFRAVPDFSVEFLLGNYVENFLRNNASDY